MMPYYLVFSKSLAIINTEIALITGFVKKTKSKDHGNSLFIYLHRTA